MNTTPALRATALATASCVLLTLASAANADAVTDWNAITQSTILAATADPAERARTAAISQVAGFEAVNSIVGDYEPYRSRIDASSRASPEAAVIVAAHRVLVTLHPSHASQLVFFFKQKTAYEVRDESGEVVNTEPLAERSDVDRFLGI